MSQSEMRIPWIACLAAIGVGAMLAIAVLYMGVYPKPFTDVMDVSVAELLRHVALSKIQ